MANFLFVPVHREFFYIQMEKYARQHLAEGIQHADELHVDCDSEIFRTLNSHYNRNTQLEVVFILPSSYFFLNLWHELTTFNLFSDSAKFLLCN